MRVTFIWPRLSLGAAGRDPHLFWCGHLWEGLPEGQSVQTQEIRRAKIVLEILMAFVKKSVKAVIKIGS